MNRGGFSFKRLLGVSRAKSRASRAFGIPFTRGGRHRKIGSKITGGGCLVAVCFGVGVSASLAVMILVLT